jgi:hypothetical protein
MKNIIQRLLLNLTRFILKKVVIRISFKYEEQNLCVNITVIIPNEAHIMGNCLQLTVEFILVISKINPSN